MAFERVKRVPRTRMKSIKQTEARIKRLKGLNPRASRLRLCFFLFTKKKKQLVKT